MYSSSTFTDRSTTSLHQLNLKHLTIPYFSQNQLKIQKPTIQIFISLINPTLHGLFEDYLTRGGAKGPPHNLLGVEL